MTLDRLVSLFYDFIMSEKQNRKEEQSEERRNQILEAASNVFSERGLQKARMDDIVHESGLSKGALYWYFKSKDEIINAILRRYLDHELAVIKKLADQPGSAEQRLRKFVDLMIADLTRMKFFTAVAYEFYAMAFRSKTIRAVFREYVDQFFSVMEPIIEQGMADGEFRLLDPKEVALAVASIVEGTLLIYGFDPERIDLEKHLKSNMHLLLNGLKRNHT